MVLGRGTGANDELIGILLQGPYDGRHLDCFGPRAKDVQNLVQRIDHVMLSILCCLRRIQKLPPPHHIAPGKHSLSKSGYIFPKKLFAIKISKDE